MCAVALGLRPPLEARGRRGGLRDLSPVGIWRERGVLLAVFAVYLVVGVLSANRRPFWFDELSTLFMSSAGSLHEVLRAAPTDGNPPLYFLLAHLCLRLPVSTELAMRLPSIVGFGAAGLAVYRFVRRRTEFVFALMALSMLLGSGIMIYAIEARPYALLLGFTGLALCSWQTAASSGRRRMALVGITAGVAGAIFSHNYGVIYGVLPILAGEATRAFRNRRLDFPMIAAAGIGSMALLLTYPVTLRAQSGLLAAIRACPNFWARPKWLDFDAYLEMMPQFFPVLAGVALFGTVMMFWMFGREKVSDRSRMRAPEIAAGAALLLLVPIMLVLTKLGTGYFVPRYAVGSAVGLAILCGFGASSASKRWPSVRRFCWSMTAYTCVSGVLILWTGGAKSMIGRTRSQPVLEELRGGSEPIVVASALQFSPIWWYAAPELRGRLHYLSDIPYNTQHSDLLPEYSLMLERAYTPMHLDDYGEFLRGHGRFLLYCTDEARLEWIRPRLLEAGWKLRSLRAVGRNELFLAEAPDSR